VKIVSGPLLYGPLLAFIISLSDISLFGFGSFFWGMLTGTVVSWIWEQKAPSESRLPGAEGD
jgi:predicted benzoate:H+ symporter BenE